VEVSESKGETEMMSRKDYVRAAQLVADVRRECEKMKEPIPYATIQENAFVSFFLGDNPRFDADRFRAACRKV
jgi:hypothetical protein